MRVGGWAGGEWSRHTARSCDHHRWWNVTIFSACVEATVCWLLFQTRCWWGTTTTSQWISLLWGLRRSWTWTQATSWKPGERVCVRFCKYPPKWCTYNANWLWHSWCHAKCFYLIYTRGTRQNAAISFMHMWVFTLSSTLIFRFFFSHYLPKWCTYSSSGCYIAGAVWNASSWCMHLLVVTISSMLI